jgi:hypothetical protein
MAATDTPKEDMISWEQPGADTSTWRLPYRGRSRFGTYQIDGPRSGPAMCTSRRTGARRR